MAVAQSVWEISSALGVSRPYNSNASNNTHQELASLKPHAFSSLTKPCTIYHNTQFCLLTEKYVCIFLCAFFGGGGVAISNVANLKLKRVTFCVCFSILWGEIYSKSKTLRSQDLAEQMKEMAAAEKRWRAQVRDGKIQAISPKQAGYALQLSDYCLLDVRPSTERSKAWVKDSIWIPIFDADKGFEPETLLKRFSNFTMGGWWSGAPLMKYNNQFLPQAMEKLSLESNIIVVCQKGLRSLAACEQLYNAGYRNLFWMEGGLDAAAEGDLKREGPQSFKFAGIGGVSEFLGWTDEQRSAGAKEGWAYRAVFFGRLVAIVLLVDALFLGAQQLGQNMKH